MELLATTGDAFVRVGAHTRLQGSGAQCLALDGDRLLHSNHPFRLPSLDHDEAQHHPDDSADPSQGVSFRPAEGGQFSRGADSVVAAPALDDDEEADPPVARRPG
jgi:hypothetical protein